MADLNYPTDSDPTGDSGGSTSTGTTGGLPPVSPRRKFTPLQIGIAVAGVILLIVILTNLF